MGWHKTRELEVVDGFGSDPDFCGLWTRGGLEGIRVQIGDKAAKIPREAILELVAAEWISKRIGHYEQLTTKQAIAEIMRGET
jgi:hypothetical protein